MLRQARPILVVTCCLCSMSTLYAGELVQLSPENWDKYVPAGKEVDCNYGDYLLRNDKIVAVIARPVAGRNANMTVRGVSGCLIDLTRRDVWNDEQTTFLLAAEGSSRPRDFFQGEPRGNDQLSAFYPGAATVAFETDDTVKVGVGGAAITTHDSNLEAQGTPIVLEIAAKAAKGKPQVTVRYRLDDDSPVLVIETVYANSTDATLNIELADALRADRTFSFGEDADTNLFWAYDEAFHAAYGIRAEGYEVKRAGGGRGVQLEYLKGGSNKLELTPGASFTLKRQVLPAAHLLEARGIAAELSGRKSSRLRIETRDDDGPVANARVVLAAGGKQYGVARSDENGFIEFLAPPGDVDLTITAIGRGTLTEKLSLNPDQAVVQIAKLSRPGYIVGRITGENGGPIPCKLTLTGIEGTASPDFGPDSGATGVQNLYYSHDGRFQLPVEPGKYQAIVSYGPEYDAVFTTLEVKRGTAAELSSVLKRTVDTKGWVSGDYHSHSSPSGDNTSSQLGRVLNLLCEHIEFAPCTEHNRIDTYVPHLERLGIRPRMATCNGMELTGSPLPVNHQNAFPLVRKPHTQDGGAPLTDSNPIAQIERLAMWDGGSDKLVQTNHPNLMSIIGDANNDGQPDGGLEKMFGFMDVMEVHPPAGIFNPPANVEEARNSRNPIFHWMQLLNLGYRIPGVVNTDAHYTHHGSGGLRNWIESSTDDTANIDTMEMVHSSEHGHLVMSSGPFLEVSLSAEGNGKKKSAIPGDDLAAPGGKAQLHVRVQCPNWFDVNRVQVFLNGRAAEKLNFTRRTTPEQFSDKTVRFEADLPLALESDTHVIVATIGEGLTLGPVMGPSWGKQPPAAVSNPIFVDVDGGGFTPNGDDLGVPLPADEAALLKRNIEQYHRHGHGE